MIISPAPHCSIQPWKDGEVGSAIEISDKKKGSRKKLGNKEKSDRNASRRRKEERK
jgi:hypothetical protein